GPAAVLVRPAGTRGSTRTVRGGRDRRARVTAGRDPARERQGRDVRAAPANGRASPVVAARHGRTRAARRRAGARLSGPVGLLQAGLFVGLTRVPGARSDRRSREAAAGDRKSTRLNS